MLIQTRIKLLYHGVPGLRGHIIFIDGQNTIGESCQMGPPPPSQMKDSSWFPTSSASYQGRENDHLERDILRFLNASGAPLADSL
jgi:hypothetical protein